MLDNVTNDSKKVLCVLYGVYTERIKSGNARDAARRFGSSEDIQKAHFKERIPEDINSNCWELARFELLDVFGADGIAYMVELSDKAIAYMENRFKNGLKEVAEFIGNLIP